MFCQDVLRSWEPERVQRPNLASWPPLGSRRPGPWGANGPKSGEETVKIAKKCKKNVNFGKKCENSVKKCEIRDFSSRRASKIYGFT